MRNRIYYFTGTGNCLKISRDIANKIGDCEVIPVSNSNDLTLPGNYDRIGFVFPVYFQGLPLALDKFLSNISYQQQNETYFFAVATYGALVGNALPQLAHSLKQKGITLDYAAKLIMFPNCVTMYDMKEQVSEKTRESDCNSIPIIDDICDFKKNKTPLFNGLLHAYYKMRIRRVNNTDFHFSADDRCSACGTCKSVCPVQNITIENGKPSFHHACEHCTACIQYCPTKALNYKNKTQKRRRYHHPEINSTTMSEAQGNNR